LLFDFFKFDIYNRTDTYSFGAGLFSGFIILAIYGMYYSLAIGTLFYIILRIKVNKRKAFIPSVIMIVTILLLTFVPYSKGYVNIFYSINKDDFQKIVQMYNKGELDDFQSNVNEYIVPYRLTSYTGKMYVQNTEGVSKIQFYASGGFRKLVIIYSSDDSGINQEDFYNLRIKMDYRNIRRIDKNWYSAVIS
jgi:hypothetical protein